MSTTSHQIDDELFPGGRPSTHEQIETALEQFKLLLGSAESLESRRQALHAFFMSINSLLLAGGGLLAKAGLDRPALGIGVVFVALMGLGLSVSWRQQISSHGKVLKAKWTVLNRAEAAFPTRPFCTEWQVLERDRYQSFTKIECYVPVVFMLLYACLAISGVLVAGSVVS